MVSGIYDLWSSISGPVIPAYGDPEGGYVVRADGGRREWWRHCVAGAVSTHHHPYPGFFFMNLRQSALDAGK